jgi:hypothetical protein
MSDWQKEVGFEGELGNFDEDVGKHQSEKCQRFSNKKAAELTIFSCHPSPTNSSFVCKKSTKKKIFSRRLLLSRG